MIRIGNYELNTRILLAPLSACSDLAFRLIAREQGAKFCFFEMIDAHSLIHTNPRSDRMLKTCAQDQPIAAQLLGLDPDLMFKSARTILERAPISFLDINAACPSPKVMKKGAGACFYNSPDSLYRVIEHLAKNLPVPITVKMRVGLSAVDIPRAVEFAKGCENAGASALFVHGRCHVQMNFGVVCYEAIRAVKQAVKVPVFGSGNVMNPPLAKKMFEEAGCDGLLVAKGSFGNPGIFREIETYLETGVWRPSVDLRGKLAVLKKHLLLIRELEGPRVDWRMGELGKICLWYLKGFAEAARMRSQIFSARTDQELLARIDGISEKPVAQPAALLDGGL